MNTLIIASSSDILYYLDTNRFTETFDKLFSKALTRLRHFNCSYAKRQPIHESMFLTNEMSFQDIVMLNCSVSRIYYEDTRRYGIYSKQSTNA
jgi:hypothetical protein